MDILIAAIGFIVGIIVGRLLSAIRTRGVLVKVLDDCDGTATGLYLALNCLPEDLTSGEIAKFKVKETHSQK